MTDVNEAPVINNQTFSIAENSANGTAIGIVVASDPDAAQTKTFSIVSGNTNGAFSINTSTGALTVANSAALNFEVTPSFALVVKVQDNGTPALNSQATINVSLTDVNEIPTINNQSFSIAENSANGTAIGTVVASDPDVAQTKTFSIVSGNSAGAFSINTSTGVLTVANSATLNFEVTPSFTLVVKVQDNGTPALNSQATVSISLIDVNEAPIINDQAFTIVQNAPTGTSVGIVEAINPNLSHTLIYSIQSGNASGTFTINPSTGELFVSNPSAIKLKSSLSFELVIKVQDNASASLINQAIIMVLQLMPIQAI